MSDITNLDELLIVTHPDDFNEVKCQVKELSTLQQKNILGTVTNDTIYNTEFLETLAQIFKDNFNPSISSNNISYCARIYYTILLRSFISTTITLQSDNGESVTINLNHVLDKLKQISELLNSSKAPLTESKYDNLHLSCHINLPRLVDEIEAEKEISSIIKSNIKKDELKNIITNSFTGELVKYVHDLKINGEVCGYDESNYKGKWSIIEKLPASFIQQILIQINKIKSPVDECLVDLEHNVTIPIDGTLFIL